MSDQETALAEEVNEAVTEPISEVDSLEATVEAETTDVEPEAVVETTSLTPADTETDEDPGNIHTLEIGQRLIGTVKNIATFGAFVDVGIPQDGLVHISKLSKQKVEKVSDVVSQGQEVEVWVKKVDTKRGRLSLTMVKPVLRRLRDIEEGAELEGTVTRLESYGAFIDIDSDRDGLVHISQITHDYIKHPEESLKVGDTIKVKVLSVNRKKRQVDLSIKALLPEPVREEKDERPREDRPRGKRPRNSKPKEEFVMPVDDSEPMMTAMAAAYAALQDDKDTDTNEAALAAAKNKRQKDTELDEIITRTLADRKN
jgi:transcriptional accessory protein Tex/SPT6